MTHTAQCYHADCDEDDVEAHGCGTGPCEECNRGGHTMTHTPGPWHLEHTFEEYRDFEETIPDNAQGIGGNVRITLADPKDQPPYAYGTIYFHSVKGEEIATAEFNIGRADAERIIGIAPLEAEANAQLIAEAGTVAHETGRTPRQLADLNKELLEALRHLQAVVRDEYHLLDIKKRASLCIADAQAGTAIARAEGRG